VAKDSLDALLIHWQTGEQIIARDWIWTEYERAKSLAAAEGIGCFLTPLTKILNHGNEAQRWLASVKSGLTPRQVLTEAIAQTEQQEQELVETLLG